jgi:aerobic carbon-monoxide dehydrogenase medium subunit
VKPAPFAYLAPRSVDEALAHLAEHGSEARPLAGGQSLVRLMNTRLATPSVLIDINRIGELAAISRENGAVRIGAVARQRACETSSEVSDGVPVFAEAVRQVAHPSVRRRGTAVGSVAFADPSAELPAALLAADGEVVARSSRGERSIAADDFFTGPFTSALAPDELAVALRIPVTAERPGSAFVEESRRHGELPMCGVAAVVTLDGDGAVAQARIALCGVHRRPIRARDAEAALQSEHPDDELLQAAGALAASAADPVGDCHGSAAFRRHLAAVLTRRALATAISRAEERNA